MKPTPSWSLLGRLFWWYGSSVFCLFLVCSVVLDYNLQSSSEIRRSSVLRDRLAAVSSLLKSPAQGRAELIHRVQEEWPQRSGERVNLVLTSESGEIWLQTPGFPQEFLPKIPEALAAHEKGISFQEAGDSEPAGYFARAEKMPSSLVSPDPLVVFAVISDVQDRVFLGEFRRMAILMVLLGTLVSLLLGWRLSKKSIEPLEQMTERVSRIDSKTLHERLSLAELPVELHELSKAFNRSLDRLQDSFERLSRFSTDIAHELRTPLTNMIGEIEVSLGRHRDSAEYEKILTSNLEESSRLKNLVESLLFLGRAENLKENFQAGPLDVRAELAAILEFFEAAAQEADIELKIRHETSGELWLEPQRPGGGPDEGPLLIRADQVLFQRAIGNLISNAIKYSDKGKKIELRYQDGGDFLILEVIDQGIGIADVDLPRLFHRFVRLENPVSSRQPGFGLGLALVKSIVELHQGRVSLSSELGQGTRVRIEWPWWTASETGR